MVVGSGPFLPLFRAIWGATRTSPDPSADEDRDPAGERDGNRTHERRGSANRVRRRERASDCQSTHDNHRQACDLTEHRSNQDRPRIPTQQPNKEVRRGSPLPRAARIWRYVVVSPKKECDSDAADGEDHCAHARYPGRFTRALAGGDERSEKAPRRFWPIVWPAEARNDFMKAAATFQRHFG